VSASPTVFGAVRLGYAVIETDRFADWRRFGADAVGMHHDGLGADLMRFRLDEHACRFLLRRGPAEDVVTIGWHADNDQVLDRMAARVHGRGVPLAEGSAEEATARGVERFLRIPGPKGITQEICVTPPVSGEPVRMRASGFVTGASGLGHVALTSRRPERVHGYFATVLDARLTDTIEETLAGLRLRVRFLRVNERHHSIAVAATRGLPLDPVRTRVQHVNIQAATLDDVARGYQRLHELGFGMALTIGQHTNDRELSYYARTPSGFEWEVGWNPIVVDETTWEPATHQGISIWGHTPAGRVLVDRLGQVRAAFGSVGRREETVPALSGPSRPEA
jgi:2,3-dihydroxybiphenyl 1,2-dioxygenase